MTESNPLVASGPQIKGTDGLGIGESAANLVGDIGKAANGEWDAFALAVDGVALGIDAISMAMDPLGEVVKAGVGWLLEHVDILREPLEILTGDHRAIEAVSQTWNNVAAELRAIGEEYEAELSATAAWSGDGADAYRKLAKQYSGSLFEISDQAAGAAEGVMYAGIAVGTMRAIIAAASSAITFGAAIAAFVASLMADLVKILAKIQGKIGERLHAIHRFVLKFNLLGKNSKQATKALGRKATELGTEAARATKQADRTLGQLDSSLARRYGDFKKGGGYAGDLADKARDTIGDRAGDIIEGGGKVAGHKATTGAKELAKQVKDQRDQASGGSSDDGKYTPTATGGRISGSIDDE